MEWLNELFKNNITLQVALSGIGITIGGWLLGLLIHLVRPTLFKSQRNSMPKRVQIDGSRENDIIKKLKNDLPHVIDDTATQKMIATKAGLSVVALAFDSNPLVHWDKIITMAHQDDRMKELVTELHKVRPSNATISHAYHHYTNSSSQTTYSLLFLLILAIIVVLIVRYMPWPIQTASLPPIGTNLDAKTLYTSTPYTITPPKVDCMSLSNPPLSIGDTGQICLAQGSTLRMRKTAGGQTTHTINNGTAFTVVGGPECAYYDYTNQISQWWQVETIDGKHGWLVDGGDSEGDPVYLCRLAEDVGELQSLSQEAVKAVQKYWALWGNSQTCLRAWETLSNDFKNDNSLVDYLQDCGTTKVQISEIIDLDQSRSDSLIEVIGQCVLLRINSKYSGVMTIGLLRTNQQNHSFKIHFARFEHSAARLRANEIC